MSISAATDTRFQPGQQRSKTGPAPARAQRQTAQHKTAPVGRGVGHEGVTIDFDAINAPLEAMADDPSDRERAARKQVEAIQIEVSNRLKEFQAMVARFGRNHDYILHQPDGSTRSCHSRDLEDLSARGTVDPADFIRNVTTGETHLAIDIPWLRSILVARRHSSFGSQSKYMKRVRQRKIMKIVALNVLVLGVLAGEFLLTDASLPSFLHFVASRLPFGTAFF